MEEKTFYFKVHGKITRSFENEDAATDYLYELLKNERRFAAQIDSMEEDTN